MRNVIQMRELETVACVGSGTIGGSWAALFSIEDYDVYLYDVEEDILEKAVNNIKSQLKFLSEKGMVAESLDKIFERINTTTDIQEAVKDADYVQESGPENLDIKKKIFGNIDKHTSEDVIIGSSTSGIFMTKIQKVAENPERCIVAHPWNPPLLVPLVEVAPGEETSEETVKETLNIMKKLGKTPVKLKKEVSGFIGNRLQYALWREALSLVKRDVASAEEIDKALTAGPGLRWSFMGSHLTFHLGGGEGGIKHFIDHLADRMSHDWKDMDDWEEVPYTAAEKLIDEMEDYEIAKDKSYEELVNWRDDNLVNLLREFYDKESI